jgi:hypothetical protein
VQHLKKRRLSTKENKTRKEICSFGEKDRRRGKFSTEKHKQIRNDRKT